MEIEYQTLSGTRRHIEYLGEGPSPAFYIDPYDKMTVHIDSVISGDVTLEWSLSTQEQVENDTARWHTWSPGAVSSARGIVFDSRVSFLRVITSAANVTYVFEALA